jgi:hypothetical protein
VPAFVNLVLIDEFLIRSLCPTPRGLIVLARKHAHGSRDGDVGGVVKVDVKFPIEASRAASGARVPPMA